MTFQEAEARVADAAMRIVGGKAYQGGSFDAQRRDTGCRFRPDERVVAEAVLRHYAGGTVCEFGAGWGLLSCTLALMGMQVTSYESWDVRAEVARGVAAALGLEEDRLHVVREWFPPGARSSLDDVVIGTNAANSWWSTWRKGESEPVRMRALLGGSDGVLVVRTFDRVRDSVEEQQATVSAFRDGGYRVETLGECAWRFVDERKGVL